MNKPLVTFALALAGATAWSASNPPALPAPLNACADLADAQQRLACFDGEVAALRKSTLPKAPVSTPAPAAIHVAPATAPAATFGQELVSKKTRPEPAGADQRLHATITAARDPVPGEYRFTLDNGQTWRQLEARYGFTLKPGDAITIGKGSMGSYRLWRDEEGSKAWVRVTRVN